MENITCKLNAAMALVAALTFTTCTAKDETQDAGVVADTGAVVADVGVDGACGAVDGAVDCATGRLSDAAVTEPLDAVAPPGPDAAAFCPREAQAVDLNAHPDDVNGGFRYDGDTTGALDATFSPCGGEGAPDILHRFKAPAAGSWRFSTEDSATAFDTIVSVRQTCDDTTAGTCNDDAGFPPKSSVTVSLRADETLYIVVDGQRTGTAGDRGAYALTVEAR